MDSVHGVSQRVIETGEALAISGPKNARPTGEQPPPLELNELLAGGGNRSLVSSLNDRIARGRTSNVIELAGVLLREVTGESQAVVDGSLGHGFKGEAWMPCVTGSKRNGRSP